MIGLSAAMWNALRDAPPRWTCIPEPYQHARPTLEALDARRLVHHRIGAHGNYEWRVTASGLHLRTAAQNLVDRMAEACTISGACRVTR